MRDDLFSGFLDGLEPPEPPPELRRLVLTRATWAMGQPPFRDRWARMWGNPILRLAWAACVVALLVCHLAITLQSRKPGTTIATSPRERDDIAVIAGLEPMRLAARPLIGALAIRDDEVARNIDPDNHTTLERSSNHE